MSNVLMAFLFGIFYGVILTFGAFCLEQERKEKRSRERADLYEMVTKEIFYHWQREHQKKGKKK